jgi:hypothetical protein
LSHEFVFYVCGLGFGEVTALVALERQPGDSAGPARRRRSARSRWPLRWTWLLIVAASVALWAAIFAVFAALF